MREQTTRELDKTLLFKLVWRQRVMFQANGVADPFDTTSPVRASLVEKSLWRSVHNFAAFEQECYDFSHRIFNQHRITSESLLGHYTVCPKVIRRTADSKLGRPSDLTH